MISGARPSLNVTKVPLGGTHLIEASAGTGKTYTITSLILRYLTEWEVPISKILAVTFTNAATAELKDRIQKRIAAAVAVVEGEVPPGEDTVFTHLLQLPDQSRVRHLLRRALADVDRAGVFTIHGFAARVLRDHPFESGAREDAELIGDERGLVVDVVTDFWSSRIATLSPEEFGYLGGTSFFHTLLRIGPRTAGAEGVPLVSVQEQADLKELGAAFLESFERARALFATDGEEVLALLRDCAVLDRVKMGLPALQKEYEQLKTYFCAERPFQAYPQKERFTQSKVDSSLRKLKGKVSPPTHPLLASMDELKQSYERLAAEAAHLENCYRHELCQILRERAEREHVRSGTQSFDGLLRDLGSALRSSTRGRLLAESLRGGFTVALIDEFQDTDPLQFEIFSRIYQPEFYQDPSPDVSGPTALYLIGDPKQSIYAFRGADVHTYLEAARRVSENVWTLKTSYRASPRLIEAQNALFTLSSDAFLIKGISYETVSPRPGATDVLLDRDGAVLPGLDLVQVKSSASGDWLRAVAVEVARFLAAGHELKGHPVGPKDIAVLTRTNSQAQDLQRLLWELSIPAVMHGDRSVLESPEAYELRRVLQALAEPGNRSKVRTALSTRLIGLCAQDLASMDADTGALELWCARLSRWGDLFRDRGVAHALEALMAEVSAISRTLSERDGERKMTNLRHLLEILHEAETSEHLGVAGLLRWLDGALADPFGHSMASEARQLRLESDADAVTLTTGHKSKGLEYEIVFLPHVGYPDKIFSDEAFRYFDEGEGKSYFEMRTKETRGASEEQRKLANHQESLRLAYVALTRAKQHVVALTGPGEGFSALHYLLHGGGSGDFLSLPRKLSLETRRTEMDLVAQGSGGALRIRAFEEGAGPKYRVRVETPRLSPPGSLPKIVEHEKTSSFSAMTRDQHGSLSRAAREGRDVDEVDAQNEVSEFSRLPAREGRAVLADFPRGAKPGDALHLALEEMPFKEGSDEERDEVIFRELSRRGFSASDIDAAKRGLADVLKTPLCGAEGALSRSKAPRLGLLGKEDKKAEMEFSLPVGAEGGRLTPRLLAESLGLRGRNEVEREDSFLANEYLESLSRLSFGAWSGFLRGFIDLVYLYEGKLYGLDYKSNHLGDLYEDYNQEAMHRAMEHHHYLLQGLLYAVAIHRYGRARLPGYTYRTHFGGMQYLFLRGMHPDKDTGVFSFRPSETLIENLSRLLGSEEEATA